FFFQAEDGIRDFHVTGVQTCALPISALFMACSKPALNVMILMAHEAQDPKSFNLTTLSAVISSIRTLPPSVSKYGRIESKACSRSEERRVGKEGRSRWWPDQYKRMRT